MDFARKQLEKYGWTDGKGLGKNENGISQALKPKLKRSVTGVGHDAASDFTEHWWTTLYNKAAGNVEVEEKNGKTKKIKTNTDDFQISNSTWKLTKTKKKSTEEEQYADYFVKKATLTNGGVKMEKVADSEESEAEKKDVFKMTDEELFAACGGRTAHKGARHGLRALGKLSRIEQQEQNLLEQEKYEGYSHHEKKKKNKKPASELKVEDLNLNSDTEIPKSKKKKKKKHCSNSESLTEIGNGNIEVAECIESEPKKNKNKRKLTDENVASEVVEENGRKNKKLKNNENNVSDPDVGCLFKSKKKKRSKNVESVPQNEAESNTNFLKTDGKYEFLDNGVVRKTKKNKKVK
ncbi:G patch domain-containing protein 4 [Leguminivora glycinivorella]|uniref:G patch domain-containing protein 4 n=1 Tax=Leguminivora glycinivorella TaxID=1035111 RepID=UPI00200E1F39|nr:G patch domain-containing protein 4 [Leguminivora glycinivorella]